MIRALLLELEDEEEVVEASFWPDELTVSTVNDVLCFSFSEMEDALMSTSTDVAWPADGVPEIVRVSELYVR